MEMGALSLITEASDHKINEDGKVIRKVWFEFIDNTDGLNLAVKDLKDNFEMYIETFEFSKIWLSFHFMPDFSKNQDLVGDITSRC